MERGYSWNRGESLNLGMPHVVINNRTGSYVTFKILPIEDLYIDIRKLPGACVLFDKDGEMSKLCSSYTDIIEVSLGQCDDDVFWYYLIADDAKPLTNREVDAIYTNFINHNISIFNLEQNKIDINLCMN